MICMYNMFEIIGFEQDIRELRLSFKENPIRKFMEKNNSHIITLFYDYITNY